MEKKPNPTQNLWSIFFLTVKVNYSGEEIFKKCNKVTKYETVLVEEKCLGNGEAHSEAVNTWW